MSLSIIVFWLDRNVNPQSRSFSSSFDADPLGDALKFANEKRAEGMRHVCMSTENSDCGRHHGRRFDRRREDARRPRIHLAQTPAIVSD